MRTWRWVAAGVFGARTVVVEGERWLLLDGSDCPDVAFFAPPDVELSPDCFPQG